MAETGGSSRVALLPSSVTYTFGHVPESPRPEEPDKQSSGPLSALVLGGFVAFGLTLTIIVVWLVFGRTEPEVDSPRRAPAQGDKQPVGPGGLTREQLSIIAADDEKTSKDKGQQSQDARRPLPPQKEQKPAPDDNSAPKRGPTNGSSR